MRYFLLLFLACLVLPFSIYAQDLFPDELLPTISTDPYNTLKGGQYQLELLPYEQKRTPPTPTPVKKQDTLLPKERIAFNQYGYIVSETEGELTISLSATRVNLNSISGGKAQEGFTEIRVSTTQPHSYSLMLQQEHDTEQPSQLHFQPTHCDGGIHTCTIHKAAQWKNDRAYGLGYSIVGSDSSQDFKNESYYRIFANEMPITVAKNEKIDSIRTTTLRYKLITPPSTEEGIYNTNVEIVALPY